MKILLLDSGKGIIPFINEIIKLNKMNEYYFFMDYEGFPYGNKSELYLLKRLKFLLNEFNKLNIDMLLICCNTLSNIYLRHPIKTSYKVKTILSLNLFYLKNNYILVTPSLKKFYLNDKRFIACKLAPLIEHDDISGIINEIKSLQINGDIILGCTHFPLARHIFKHYLKYNVLSYENVFIDKIPSSSTLSFSSREYEKKIIEKYFPFLRINIYSLS